ncbi:MAG: tyrosine-type recombinase/integrase [Clostridia bacterium]
MVKDNYFDERNIKNLQQIEGILQQLPYFCRDYFVGIEQRTSALTRLNYAYDLRIFFNYIFNVVHLGKLENFEISSLNHISASIIENYLGYLSYYKDENNKIKTNSLTAKARKLATLKSFFKYFYNKDKLSENVASKVSMPKIKDKAIIRLEVDEVVKLLDSVESGDNLTKKQISYHSRTKIRDVAIMTLFLGTGIRISELVGINVENIDFSNSSFKITRKGGNEVILYMSTEVLEAMYDYYCERCCKENENLNNNAFFLSLQKTRLTVRAVEMLVKKYSSLAIPLKKITPHKLRSTYGTNLYRETNDIYVVAEVLGHSDINTTKRHYAAISEDIKRNASRKITLREKK